MRHLVVPLAFAFAATFSACAGKTATQEPAPAAAVVPADPAVEPAPAVESDPAVEAAPGGEMPATE